MSSSPVVPLEYDLSILSTWLRLQGIAHRIVEEGGGQVILLHDERHQALVSEALQRYIAEAEYRVQVSQHVHALEKERQTTRSVAGDFAVYTRALPSQAPVIFSLIAVSIFFALVTDFGQGGPLLRLFLIVDPFIVEGDLATVSGRWTALLDLLIMGEVWRLISPDFIHFSALHITFNLLMLWVLGGQLEIQKGSLSFIALVVFVSIISNIAQLLETSYLFGGLSGVVYGLVGYCWLWKLYDKSIFFPDALFKFSVIWLLLGYTPLTEWLGLGKMANAAHLYGLIAGIVWAAVTLYVNEGKRNKGV